MLAKRLKMVFDEVISPSQSTFILGRLILDNCLVGFECLHAIQNSRGRSTGSIALKLDMRKAYDQVEWPFLHLMLIKIGFPYGWVSCIMTCVQSVSFFVLINSQPNQIFRPSRGLRQGDPLSPFLFFIYVEGLSAMLNNGITLRAFSSLQINKHCPMISHLFFAEDSL